MTKSDKSREKVQAFSGAKRGPASTLRNYGLVADVGGTNIRFGVVALDGAAGPVVQTQASFPAARYAGIAEAAQAYLASLGATSPPSAAVLALAGPPQDGGFAMTNSKWRTSVPELCKALGTQNVRLINDFEAIALSVPRLAAEDFVAIGGVAGPERRPHEVVAIVGPGTGLGVAGFVRTNETILPLAGEGGHVSFAPIDALEIEVLRSFMARFGRVSVERLLSGPGLRNLHAALATIEGVAAPDLSPEEITLKAEADSASLCGRVFAMFCAILGSVAGDVALTLGARDGVLIAGGILPRHPDFLAHSAFRARFEAKGRFENYMKKIPTRLIVQTWSGLIGAATLLAQRPGGAVD